MTQNSVAELLDRVAANLRAREADLNRRRAAVGLPAISLDPDKIEFRGPNRPGARAGVELVALPTPRQVKNLGRPADDEEGWLAIALERDADNDLKYVVVKGDRQESLPASSLAFGSSSSGSHEGHAAPGAAPPAP